MTSKIFKCVLLFVTGTSLFVGICCYTGILIYTTYNDCDPKTLGRIKADDQILPLFVIEVGGHLKGVPGLFMAGVFGAALSSASVAMNTLPQVIFEDFIKGCMRMTPSEKTAIWIVKSLVLAVGTLSLGLFYLVEHAGGILVLSNSITSIASGVTCGIFTLGMMIPWTNSYGAIVGGTAGVIVSSLVSFGNRFAISTKLIVPHKLPTYVNDSCFDKYGSVSNITISELFSPDESSVFPLFRLSYMWIPSVGLCTVLVVGIAVSFLTGKTDIRCLDPDLLSPVARWILPKEVQRYSGSSIRKMRHEDLEESDKMMNELSILDVKN